MRCKKSIVCDKNEMNFTLVSCSGPMNQPDIKILMDL